MVILIIIVVLLIAILIGCLIAMEGKKEDANAILEAVDVFRRIGYGDRKAIMEDWNNLKKTKAKWIICEAWGRVFDEFQRQGNTEAVNMLAYWVGDEVRKYLEELRDFYEKADEEARNWMN